MLYLLNQSHQSFASIQYLTAKNFKDIKDLIGIFLETISKIQDSKGQKKGLEDLSLKINNQLDELTRSNRENKILGKNLITKEKDLLNLICFSNLQKWENKEKNKKNIRALIFHFKNKKLF